MNCSADISPLKQVSPFQKNVSHITRLLSINSTQLSNIPKITDNTSEIEEYQEHFGKFVENVSVQLSPISSNKFTKYEEVPPIEKLLMIENVKLQKLLKNRWEGFKPENASFVKCLVGEDVAGYLIGRNGTGIEEFQKRHGPGMKLSVSRVNEKFPGTESRIVVLVGVHVCVLSALSEILEVLLNRAAHKPEETDLRTGRFIKKPKVNFLLVIPQTSANLVIGSKGHVVSLIARETNSNVYLTRDGDIFHQRSSAYTLQERICQISGSREQVVKAVLLTASFYQCDKTLSNFQQTLYVPRPPPPPPPVCVTPPTSPLTKAKLVNWQDPNQYPELMYSPDKATPVRLGTEYNLVNSPLTLHHDPPTPPLQYTSCHQPESIPMNTEGDHLLLANLLSNVSSVNDNDAVQLINVIEDKDESRLDSIHFKVTTEISAITAEASIVKDTQFCDLIEQTTKARISLRDPCEDNAAEGNRTVEIEGSIKSVCAAFALCQSLLEVNANSTTI